MISNSVYAIHPNLQEGSGGLGSLVFEIPNRVDLLIRFSEK